MANEQNLIPLGSGQRSEEEEREMRSRGGKKSGETRRKKTAMKKMANLLLNMPVSEEAYPTIINTLQKMGKRISTRCGSARRSSSITRAK